MVSDALRGIRDDRGTHQALGPRTHHDHHAPRAAGLGGLPAVRMGMGPMVMTAIVLVCPHCDARRTVPREPQDPPNACSARFSCPKCWDGDFETVYYFDPDGREVFEEP